MERPAQSSAQPSAEKPSSLAISSPVKILIADDNRTDRLRLQRLLENLGHTVVSAANGAEATELFLRENPHLVLLDAMMPVMDGFEAAKIIKQHTGDQFVPIVFLTFVKEADLLARCMEAGDDFLPKPYNSVILKSKINAHIRMIDMHHTVLRQRDEIAAHNYRLVQEQEVAKRVFDKVAHIGCLDAPNIQYVLSPLAVFNGDVALAGISPSGNLLVLLADFTGHGLSAAIGAMPMAQAFYSMLEKGFGMRDILREINAKLHEILPVGVFCCAAVAELDYAAQLLRVWNGGLPEGVIYHPATKTLTKLPSKHLPLGIRNAVEFNNQVDNYEIKPGDQLYLWSDGIIEAENRDEKMFGEQRLYALFADNTDPQMLFHEINSAVNSYIGEGAANDDLSLIQITVVPPELPMGMSHHGGHQDVGPRDWSMRYDLRPDSLRDFDPLPLMLHVLMQVPFLRPVSGQIYTVMAELFTNALEHGLLELDSAIKTSPDGFTEFYRLRGERLQQLRQGWISMGLQYAGNATGGCLIIEIEDSGAGFDYDAIFRNANMGDISRHQYAGRGIQLLRSLCHSVSYSGCGNKVKAVFPWGDAVDGKNPIG